jgi:3-oxoadipate enol-lactonase
MPQLSVHNATIFYDLHTVTNPKGTIAFFNGVMASISSWDLYVEAFTGFGYNVLVHDFRGQLLSEKPPGPFTFSQHAADAVKLFSQLGIEKPHIIGTSYGGEVAMRLAIDYPDIPRTISVIDSVSETDEIMDGFIDLWIDLAQRNDPEKFFWGMVPTVYSSQFIRSNRNMLEERAHRMTEIPADYFTGQIYLYETFKNDVRMTEELHTVRCPACVLCGELDTLKPVPFSRKIAGAIPNAEFAIIPDSGHVTIFEQPQVLISILLGFVIKHSG